MKEIIKSFIELAKQSETHEYCDCLTRQHVVDMCSFMPLTDSKEIEQLLKDNNCTCSIISEGTMSPKITIKYLG